MDKRVVILRVDDWEVLFIDGEKISEGHELGDGDSLLFLLKKSEEYNFSSKDIDSKWIGDSLSEGQNEYLMGGNFPDTLKEWNEL